MSKEKSMKVLVACEESQAVCKAFRDRGHIAFSADIKDCSGGYPEWHIKGDVIEHLKSVPLYYYDLIIAHPPCTYLSVAGAVNFYKDGQRNEERFRKQEEARAFFMFFYDFTWCDRICIENPRAMKSAALPPFSQVIQPYDFGDSWSKQTCLWLKGLPYLFPSFAELNRRSAAPSWVAKYSSSVKRSKTFNGIARAMAQQWG